MITIRHEQAVQSVNSLGNARLLIENMIDLNRSAFTVVSDMAGKKIADFLNEWVHNKRLKKVSNDQF